MIDKRLFKIAKKQTLIIQVIIKLLILLCSLIIWLNLAKILTNLFINHNFHLTSIVIIFLALLGKVFLISLSTKYTHHASSNLKVTLRKAILTKAIDLNTSSKQMAASRLTQLASDGIEQIELYFANFLPQLFYATFAALIIFVILATFYLKAALIMLICIPLIPLIIMSIMKIAKRILGKYWHDYTNLGENFHEGLQGFETLVAYGQDEYFEQQMQADAERFRKATMSLLAMQLNSIGVMDIVSYSGTGLGLGLALFGYCHQQLSLYGMISFILLSAEFFLPMRLLGSLFHVAMNGISSCSLLFDYLDLPTNIVGTRSLTNNLKSVSTQKLNYSYDQTPTVSDVDIELAPGLYALVGKSGSGKSTIGRLLLGQLTSSNIQWNNFDLQELNWQTRYKHASYVSNDDYLYHASLRYNLVFEEDIADETIFHTLQLVGLSHFQLDTVISENGKNLSGGERQRLLLARALLQDSDFYVFDEITAGVDQETEELIAKILVQLAQSKIVLLITHRLYQTKQAKCIYLLEQGKIVATGNYAKLNEESPFFQDYLAKEQFEGGINNE